ncbi:hypothetical protein GEOBRER4_n0876 [Citrifermentans bremense]|uniref:Uncharacterized protein n=1 Tax=Citrifermentans bremense TaxID=60035 RepID=A0A7R7J018_9BACT|nr:hypothetical protein GEOBRER4_n0876 [Citrifermentans bremense]
MNYGSPVPQQFRKEERRFSVGDRIVALKDDDKLDLQK